MSKKKKQKQTKQKFPPRHPELEFLKDALGPCRESVTFEEALIEFIDSQFMFEEFPGFEEGVYQVRNILLEYNVEIKSKTADGIFSTYYNHALEEYYGDFDRFVICSKCFDEYKPEFNLKLIRNMLSNSNYCNDCKHS